MTVLQTTVTLIFTDVHLKEQIVTKKKENGSGPTHSHIKINIINVKHLNKFNNITLHRNRYSIKNYFFHQLCEFMQETNFN